MSRGQPDHDLYARLDMARGLSALVVFAAHMSQVFVYRLIGPVHPVSQLGGTAARAAVLIFFLISGYLITRSIRANIERFHHFDMLDYLSSRIGRIYPPLVGAILVIVGCWLLIHGFSLAGSVQYGFAGDVYRVRPAFDVTFHDIWLAITMRPGLDLSDGPLWSLFIEFELYLVAMGVAMVLAGRFLAVRAAGALLAVVVVQAGQGYNPNFLFFGSVFCIGAFLCIFPLDRQLMRIVAMLSAFVMLNVLVVKPDLFSLSMDTRFGHILQFVSCGLFSYLLFSRPREVVRGASYLVRTADFSYSLYILHFPLLLLMLSLSQNWIMHSAGRTALVCAIAFPGIVAFAMAFAAVLERPKLFKRWLLLGAHVVWAAARKIRLRFASGPVVAEPTALTQPADPDTPAQDARKIGRRIETTPN